MWESSKYHFTTMTTRTVKALKDNSLSVYQLVFEFPSFLCFPLLFFSFPLSQTLFSSSSQLLLYFTAIKPGNFNQVAQREFLQGQGGKE